MVKSILSFLKSIDFFKSITLLFAILVPLALFGWLDKLPLAVSVVTGVFLCSPSDVPGSIRHMALGMVVSSLLAILNTLAIHLSLGSVWILLPVLSVLVFCNSMLSVYGFRASLVSFSGLLAMILAFAHPTSGIDLLIHLGLILAGCLWYLGVSLLVHLLMYRRQNQLILAECMNLTAQYLRIRGELVYHPKQTDSLQKELFRLQTDINEKHEKLREIFATERTRSGRSYSANKYVLIFIDLIDILELAIANPANYQRISTFFGKEDDSLKPFVDILYALSDQLEVLAAVVSGDQKLKTQPEGNPLYEKAHDSILRYSARHQFPATNEGVLILKSMLDYERKQQQKIASIERVLRDVVDQDQLIHRSQEAKQFISHQDYDPRIIGQNLTPTSTIFRHAMRLTVTVLAGYALGAALPVQNSYWIILTIIIVMRPGYGLTKSRSIQRVCGTLIGAGIALGIVLLISNPYVYGILAAVSLIFGFSLVQKNYGSAATFITLYVIFLYALLRPDAIPVIQFRVLDTLLGAGLAFLASFFLWPSWEFLNIRQVIADSIQANRHYLRAISAFYQNKGALPTSYKLARKEAFLAIGNLSAAFQRMSQEPTSKRQHYVSIYEMAVLNHTLLAAAAALGTFIQTHITSEKSPHFQTFIDSIDRNLEAAQASLNQEAPVAGPDPVSLDTATSYLERQYREVAEHHKHFSPESLLPEHEEKHHPLQEASLVTGQLTWLHALSENIRDATQELTPG